MAEKSQFLACNIIWFGLECVIIKCVVAILFLGINSPIVFMQMVKGWTGDVANWLYGNGLEPSGNMPLPEPVLAKITDATRLILVKIRSNVTKWVRRGFKYPNHEDTLSYGWFSGIEFSNLAYTIPPKHNGRKVR